MRRSILISAYACRPGLGSEPGVGWNVALHLSKHHDVHVITRIDNRTAIESVMRTRPIRGLTVHYHCLPEDRWHVANWNKLAREVHYHRWQQSVYKSASRLHDVYHFDLSHHVTYCRYWTPNSLSRLPIPYLWGPVGGGDRIPNSLFRGFRPQDFFAEKLREVVHTTAERFRSVQKTASGSSHALATTSQTAARLSLLGAANVDVVGESALSLADVEMLAALPEPPGSAARFISIGRLLHLKGFQFGLRAFAEAEIPGSEYWIVGDGPYSGVLRRLAEELGIRARVRFFGKLPREEGFERLGRSHVLVHPSMHDSGGWVCLEAMAARRPVLCLDLGGPGYQVTDETGIKIKPTTTDAAVSGLAQGMRRLATDSLLRMTMGEAGLRRVRSDFTWPAKVCVYGQLYEDMLRFRDAANPSQSVVTRYA